jgi:uncharacterized protein (TIGR02996 family)
VRRNGSATDARAIVGYHEAFIAAVADCPDDSFTPLVYADWLEERGDPRARLLRVWVDLAWRASHASAGFRDLLAEYRRLWLAADPDWRQAFGAARPWVDARLAEELARGYLRYVERRPRGQRGVIPGATTWFPEPSEPYPCGWLVEYWFGHWYTDRRGQRREYKWVLFVQPELGWVYSIATAGPKLWLQRYDVAAGQGRAF